MDILKEYKVATICENCGHRGTKIKHKGIPISGVSGECPNCGCNTLKERQL